MSRARENKPRIHVYFRSEEKVHSMFVDHIMHVEFYGTCYHLIVVIGGFTEQLLRL